jgi:hypothetical protein
MSDLDHYVDSVKESASSYNKEAEDTIIRTKEYLEVLMQFSKGLATAYEGQKKHSDEVFAKLSKIVDSIKKEYELKIMET